MHRFVHVGFFFGSRQKVAELEPVFTAIGSDWIRYATNCWILWTDKPAAHIYTLLEGRLDPNDSVLISGLNFPDSFGFLPPWIWGWFQSKQSNLNILYGDTADQIRSLPSEYLMFGDAGSFEDDST